MRANTRWEVDEPMSTPTLSRRISSSPSSVRPALEKKTRPPGSSVIHPCISSWPGLAGSPRDRGVGCRPGQCLNKQDARDKPAHDGGEEEVTHSCGSSPV